jgi:lysophospholipase L1-like esterase
MKTQKGPLVALSITSVIVALVIAEVGLRIAGVYASYNEKNNGGSYISPWCKPLMPGWLWTYKPNDQFNTDSKEFAHPVKTNSLGMNAPEWPVQKTKPLRIACIGDSFTEGVGAPADSTYPAQLEKLLDTAEVMNCGVSGSDPVFGYMLLKEKLLAYQPDVVVVAINNSDISDVYYRGGFERFAPGNKMVYPAPWWEPLYAHSYVVRLFIHKALHYNRFMVREDEWPKEEQKSLNILAKTMVDIQGLCKGNHIRCIFLLHPFRFEVREQKMVCQPLANSPNDSMEVVNMYEVFEENGVREQNADEYFWPNDSHNTPKGYALFARSVADKISARH